MTAPSSKAPRETAVTLPSAGEHGVNGYTQSAVGGFGASYAAQVAHGGESESPGEPSNSELDSEAQPSVGDALGHMVLRSLGRAHIDAADLRVEASGSEVRLHGTVRKSFEKAELEARARAVPGVTSVVNELTVLRGDWDNG